MDHFWTKWNPLETCRLPTDRTGALAVVTQTTARPWSVKPQEQPNLLPAATEGRHSTPRPNTDSLTSKCYNCGKYGI